MPFLDKAGLEHLSGIIKQKYAGKDSNGAVVSVGADYAEYGDWNDGNPNSEDRKGYFITIVNGTDNIAIAKSDSAIIGVTTSTAGFIGNYSAGSETNSARGLVGIVGQVSVIDNGTCTVGERCMPNDSGTAEPSPNSCGYKVIERIDDTHVKILISPTIDMVQRIRTDMVNVQSAITDMFNFSILNQYKVNNTTINVDITVAMNANKTLYKLYGTCRIKAGKTLTLVSIPGAASSSWAKYGHKIDCNGQLAKKDTAYLVNTGGLASWENTLTTANIGLTYFAVGTDGNAYVMPDTAKSTTSGTTNPFLIYYPACLYVNADFGDTPLNFNA